MTKNIPTNYKLISKQLASLIEDEKNLIAILSNTSALLNDTIDQINWVGFTLLKITNLFLGHFKVILLVYILLLVRVCGTAVSSGETQRVKDVHQFPGHIACDANSQSEIVIPLHQNGKIIGVLDIDAPIKTDFHKMIKKDLNPL